MSTDYRELIERLHREEVERIRQAGEAPPGPRPRPRQIEGLPDAEPDDPVAPEWDLFRQEVERLIAQGDKGRFAVVKVGHPITVWDTLRDALHAARLLHGQQMCLVQEIQRYLPPLRLEGDRSWRD
jgi:hypothetical protein